MPENESDNLPARQSVEVNKGGRPTKLNEEVIRQVSQALRAGNYQEVAAKYAGISDSSYWGYLERGRRERARLEADPDAAPIESEAIFVAFVNEVEKARAAAEVRAVGLIADAMSDEWKAAAWYLERSQPTKWGRRERHEIVGGGPDGIIKVEHEHRVEVNLDRSAAILAALEDSGVLDDLQAGIADAEVVEDEAGDA